MAKVANYLAVLGFIIMGLPFVLAAIWILLIVKSLLGRLTLSVDDKHFRLTSETRIASKREAHREVKDE